MKTSNRTAAVLLALVTLLLAGPVSGRQTPQATHVLVVTMDGMRWQEVFGGVQSAILDDKKDSGVDSPAPVAARFGGPTPEARRSRLLPFIWGVVARDGQVFGDPSRASEVRVTNGLWFSYPGYNELLAGFPDPRVDSNDKVYNPNATVLEWLNHRPGFQGRVAAFASWELLPWILNAPRSGIPCNASGAPIAAPGTDYGRAIDDLSADLPPYWSDERFDAPTGFGAIEYLKRAHPRVLYVMLGETDDWAHGRRYDLYLDSAARNDRFIRRLWETAQAIPEYAGHTALVIATDHGRGATGQDWTDHGQDVPAARRIWIAVMGPGVSPLGVRANVHVTQAQVAATIASLVGEDYRAAQPKAAPPLDLHR
ncbi:MAG TPA: hypothetical protein VFX12_10080 [Vicinamibacterales bacterium]|nr:hypothetical protein [Vicinamibacterales bacterium]